MTTRLETEIGEQPEVAARLVDRVRPDLAAYAALLRGRGTEQVLTVGRGSSANAARYGRTLWETRTGLATGSAAPSTTTVYDAAVDWRRRAVVAVSQSGRSPDVVTVVERARAAGRPTLAVTNAPDSPLALAADAVLDLGCGDERSVAATKTYTASALALALLGVGLDGGRGLEEVAAVPAALDAAVRSTSGIDAAAGLLAGHDRGVTVGRGLGLATAREAALKLTELTGALVMPFSPPDLLHGPVAAVGPGVPVVLVGGRGPARASVADLVPELVGRGAPLVALGDLPAAVGSGALPVRPPAAACVADWLEPIVTVVAAQLLAWRTAERRGVDVDRPGGLSKVTLTR